MIEYPDAFYNSQTSISYPVNIFDTYLHHERGVFMNSSWRTQLKQPNASIGRSVDKRRRRTIRITGASCMGNAFVGLGKLLIGIASPSLFTCVSACYTFGMVIAKGFAVAGMFTEKDETVQRKYCRLSGVILIVASACYILYSLRLFIFPEHTVFHEYVAIGIAAITFAEIGLNISGVLRERKNHSLPGQSVKMINLAASLISLVLTQTALLSFASDQVDAHPTANGFMGILMGTAATIIGMLLVVKTKRQSESDH